MTAVIDAGLRLEFLHEHRSVAWQALPILEPVGGEVSAGSYHQRRVGWQLPEAQRDHLPLMYSLKASGPLD